jgi:hypothetical protein
MIVAVAKTMKLSVHFIALRDDSVGGEEPAEPQSDGSPSIFGCRFNCVRKYAGCLISHS